MVAAAYGEVHSLTLKQAVDLALRQNPDLTLARLDEERQKLEVKIAKDPFRPKIFVGSGLAYSYGFPMSIEGSAPSIMQVKAVASIFNKSHDYQIAQTIEQTRTAAIDTQMRRDQIVFQTSMLYLDASRWGRTVETAKQQIASLEKSDAMIKLRVQDGRELEITAKQSALALAKARQRVRVLEQEQQSAEATLGNILGFGGEDRVQTAAHQTVVLTADSEGDVLAAALAQSKELRRLESALLAKGHELRQYRSKHLPSLDLVAQYGLFAKFNNYEDYFRKFQRNNGQIGVSVQVPLFRSSAIVAQGAQVETDISRLKIQVNQTRARIVMDARKSHQQVALMEQGREVAKLDLDVAREQVNVVLARFEEGRANVKELEDARFLEQEKWIAYYDAQFLVERAKLELLRQTGALLASLN